MSGRVVSFDPGSPAPSADRAAREAPDRAGPRADADRVTGSGEVRVTRSGEFRAVATAPLLGDLLLQKKLITDDQLRAALERQKRTRQRLGEVLVAMGLTTPDVILAALSAQLGLSSTRVNVYTVDPEAVRVLPEKVARRHMVFPLIKIDGTLLVAVSGPKDLQALDDLRFAAGCRIQMVLALEEEIGAALDRYYSDDFQPPQEEATEASVQLEAHRADVEVRDEEAERTAVNIVERLIARAANDGASDIHLEPTADHLRVRLRIDGTLRDLTTFPINFAPAILSRIKVLGGMDIAERRLPQDGRFSANLDDRRLDLRTSTYPTLHGEKAVLRLLDQSALRLQLENIGMTRETLDEYRALTHRPEGMMIITGPTGSGKTSTLYATLAELVETGRNITTIENPIEYAIPGINQGQTNEKAGFTFARGLRAVLRQDPDVIMVGEIRDAETLQTAVEAALTGHLVLTTLHTNGAVSSVARLQEMGLEPYLLASSVLGIAAQRLVRRICQFCRKPFPTPPGAAHFFPDALPDSLYRGVGCKDCRGTGFHGRIGVFELARMTDNFRDLVLERASEQRLLDAARRGGLRTLREECLARVVEGQTTLEEVVRVTQERN